MVESIGGQDCFVFSGTVESRDQINVNILKQGWQTFV